jgi:hypothetical protein
MDDIDVSMIYELPFLEFIDYDNQEEQTRDLCKRLLLHLQVVRNYDLNLPSFIHGTGVPKSVSLF